MQVAQALDLLGRQLFRRKILEIRVAAEDLVATFAGKQNFDPFFTGALRDQIVGNRASYQRRIEGLEAIDDLRQGVENLSQVDDQLLVIGADVLGHRAGVADVAAFAHAHRKRLQSGLLAELLFVESARQIGDHAAVHTSAEQCGRWAEKINAVVDTAFDDVSDVFNDLRKLGIRDFRRLG